MVFDFFNMFDNYEERKVDRYEEEGLIVSTCAVTDSDEPFETGVSHPQYNDGKWVVVELYHSKKEAQEGHVKWVNIMTAQELPKELKDVSTASITKSYYDDEWRIKPKTI